MLFRKIIIALTLFMVLEKGKTEPAEVVFFEHSIKWTTENRFPYYFKLPDVKLTIDSFIVEQLQQKFGFTSVKMPEQIGYKVITGFGKTKINWPANASSEVNEVAIVSGINRGTNNTNMYWSMQVVVRKAGKILFTREISHELKPFAMSFYMSPQRWIEKNDFVSLFKDLVSEAFDMREALPEVLVINSKAIIDEKVKELIPDFHRYDLIMADIIEGKIRNRAYQIRNEEEALYTWVYRNNDFVEKTYKENFTGAFIGSLINSASGGDPFRIPIPQKYELRLNTIESTPGEKWVIREASEANPGGKGGNGQQETHVTGFEFFPQNRPGDVRQSFVYIKLQNSNGEVLGKKNIKQAGGTFQTLGVTTTHLVKSKVNEIEVNATYAEQDGLVVLTRNANPVAIVTMINENPDSKQFFELELYGKNKTVVTSMPEAGLQSPLAQRYSIYFKKPMDNETLQEDLRLLITMFQTIEWPLPDPDAEFQRQLKNQSESF